MKQIKYDSYDGKSRRMWEQLQNTYKKIKDDDEDDESIKETRNKIGEIISGALTRYETEVEENEAEEYVPPKKKAKKLKVVDEVDPCYVSKEEMDDCIGESEGLKSGQVWQKNGEAWTKVMRSTKSDKALKEELIEEEMQIAQQLSDFLDYLRDVKGPIARQIKASMFTDCMRMLAAEDKELFKIIVQDCRVVEEEGKRLFETYEAICIDNTGMEADFDKGVTYLVAFETEEFMIVETAEGKEKVVMKGRFRKPGDKEKSITNVIENIIEDNIDDILSEEEEGEDPYEDEDIPF